MWLPKSYRACPSADKQWVTLLNYIRYSWWGRIFAEMDTEPTELGGGLLKVAIGVQLLLPLSTFGTSVSFQTLSIFPEWAWGMVLVLLGAIHLMALQSGKHGPRRWTARMGAFVWMSISATFWIANPASLGAVIFFFAGVAQGWASTRLTGDPYGTASSARSS